MYAILNGKYYEVGWYHAGSGKAVFIIDTGYETYGRLEADMFIDGPSLRDIPKL